MIAAHGRVGAVGVGVEELPDGGVPLGDERAVVEQAGASTGTAEMSTLRRAHRPRAGATAAANAARLAGVSGARSSSRGTATRGAGGAARRTSAGQARLRGSAASGPVIAGERRARQVRSAAKTVTQS